MSASFPGKRPSRWAFRDRLRASGVEWDIRKAYHISVTKDTSSKIPVGEHGDCYDRYLVRLEEMRQTSASCARP